MVSPLPESRRPEWDAYVEGNDLSIAWQVFEWHDIVQNHFPHEFIPLAATDHGRIRGVLPLYLLQDKRFRSQFISVPFAVAGGIVSDGPEIDEALVQGALELAGRYGVTSLVLKQYKHRIAGDLRTDDFYHNRELSLTPGLDQVWKGLDPVNREMITAAGKHGLSLEFPSPAVDEFYRLLFSYHHRQGVPCESRRWVGDLIHSGMYQCALVRHGGRAIAGTLVKSFKRTASFPFTCLKGSGPVPLQAAYWLYWELISWHGRNGYEIIHSGRIPADEAVPPFRLGWNGTKYPYFYQYHPNTGGGTESSQKRGWKRRVFTRAWRLLPKPAVAFLSPYLVRRFP